MEHFITKIEIEKVRHLENIEICLSETERRHLLITGKNGSGKTSLLESVLKCLRVALYIPEQYARKIYNSEIWIEAGKDIGVKVHFNSEGWLKENFNAGEFVTAYFPALRKAKIILAKGVEDIKLVANYEFSATPEEQLIKYMVHTRRGYSS